jgi:hypothetical protein
MSKFPQIYDVTIDKLRDCTQSDINKLQLVANAYAKVRDLRAGNKTKVSVKGLDRVHVDLQALIRALA